MSTQRESMHPFAPFAYERSIERRSFPLYSSPQLKLNSTRDRLSRDTFTIPNNAIVMQRASASEVKSEVPQNVTCTYNNPG